MDPAYSLPCLLHPEIDGGIKDHPGDYSFRRREAVGSHYNEFSLNSLFGYSLFG